MDKSMCYIASLWLSICHYFEKTEEKCILFASSYLVYHVSLLDYIVMHHAHNNENSALKIILLGQILRHTYMVDYATTVRV